MSIFIYYLFTIYLCFSALIEKLAGFVTSERSGFVTVRNASENFHRASGSEFVTPEQLRKRSGSEFVTRGTHSA